MNTALIALGSALIGYVLGLAYGIWFGAMMQRKESEEQKP